MPADRGKRSTKKEDNIQLTWTTPVEAAPAAAISFAPSLTPTSFDAFESSFATDANTDDGNAATAAASSSTTTFVEPALFPPLADANAPRKPTHAKKKAENHIPRPPNAFILFRSSFIKSNHVSNEVEGNHSTLSKIIGLTWQNMPEEERKFWHGKAKAAQADHKRKYPDYAFRPLHARGQPAQPKRRVREVAPKDVDRCARIAELLVEGKKGADLEAAMQEFDRTNVKPIVARFEAPLTARQYRRRSCSQPPELEHHHATESRASSPKPSKRKVRATSSQPAPSRRFASVTSATAPSTPSPTTPVAVSPILEEAENVEDVYAGMPPLVLPPVAQPTPAFPSFSSGDGSSFSFDFGFNETSTATSFVEPCDPLSRVPSLDGGADSALCATPDSESQRSASSAAGGFAPLSVDTSFYDAWSTSTTSTASPSFPGSPCTPGAFSDHPPLSALSTASSVTPQLAFAHQGICHTPVGPPPTVYDAHCGFGPIVFTSPPGVPPPYLDLASAYMSPIIAQEQQQQQHQQTHSAASSPLKGDAMGSYPYYAHKLVDEPHHPHHQLAAAVSYAQNLFTTYSM